MPKNNRIVIDLKKVQWATLLWFNQERVSREHKPSYTSSHGIRFDPTDKAAYHPAFPGETNLARAKRLGVLDIWHPECRFQVTANHTVTYAGKKALEMHRAWCALVFKKNK